MAVGTLHATPERRLRRVWRFGDCEFDELRHELRVKGVAVQLESKPLEVLRQLLLSPHEVLTKEVLLQSVWPGLTVVDGSLATAVSKLRKVLGGDQIIVTVPRVGYRMGVPVRGRETVSPGTKRMWVLVGIIALTVALLAIAAFGVLRYKKAAGPVRLPMWRHCASASNWKNGAGDGDRTRDIQLGNLPNPGSAMVLEVRRAQ